MRYCRISIAIVCLHLSGCLYGGRERVDNTMSQTVARPYDVQPAAIQQMAPPQPPPMSQGPIGQGPVSFGPVNQGPVNQGPVSFGPVNQGQPGPAFPQGPTLPGTAPQAQSNSPANAQSAAPPGTDIRTVGYLSDAPEAMPGASGPAANEPRPAPPKLNLNIPPEIPGSEAPLITVSRDPQMRRQETQRLYPPLPPLQDEPQAIVGPLGRPYTLADLQSMAAANSPTLKQAAADIETARGNMIQANAYPNPTLSFQATPSNNGATPGADGIGIDQVIKTGGKLKLATASAEMSLHNAELAFRRARSDLSTQVRNAYFALIVAKEAVRVNKSLARFTDEVYYLQERMLEGGFAAPYEPAALRAQAFSTRLSYKQSVQTYIYSWKQLVTAVNVRQMPLTQVAGRVDAMIPFYDFDAVQAYVLRNHTDVLTAQNAIRIARYNLQLAQVTPVPDVDFNMAVLKDFSAEPKGTTPTLSVGIPLGVWDRNKGAILAAEGALVRAEEEPHRVEMNLSNTLAGAYMSYKNNLEALDYYRRYILPDQVRCYRGTYERRQLDQNASFGDLVQAQQTLVTDVSTYLQTLGQVWTSVVSVADLIETDDLFAFSRPETVPPLPDLSQMPQLPCCHSPAVGAGR